MASPAMSGFPEWLPEQELVQQRLIDVVREQFELHGFLPLRLRSIERLGDLLHQGETDKEIYGVHRHGAEPSETGDAGDGLALHYDLTVPFARYVGERSHQITFPFRRYQIQPAWRGERPQLGRYHEFLQADADIIGRDVLATRHDADMLRLLRQTMDALEGQGVPRTKLMVNNRKLFEGLLLGAGVASDRITPTLRIIDKLAKLGKQKVVALLADVGLAPDRAAAMIDTLQTEIADEKILAEVEKQGGHELYLKGLAELRQVLTACWEDAAPGTVVGALHIARGFDYYTGTVVEGYFAEHPTLGAVCSGGRYDNLASGDSMKLPGMGVSVGISRVMGFCLHLGLFKETKKTPAVVFVAVHSEETRAQSDLVARTLRGRGIPTVVANDASAYGKQIRAAEQLGVPYLWFPASGDKGHEVKDLVRREQADADLATWAPPSPGRA